MTSWGKVNQLFLDNGRCQYETVALDLWPRATISQGFPPYIEPVPLEAME